MQIEKMRMLAWLAIEAQAFCMSFLAGALVCIIRIRFFEGATGREEFSVTSFRARRYLVVKRLLRSPAGFTWGDIKSSNMVLTAKLEKRGQVAFEK